MLQDIKEGEVLAHRIEGVNRLSVLLFTVELVGLSNGLVGLGLVFLYDFVHPLLEHRVQPDLSIFSLEGLDLEHRLTVVVQAISITRRAELGLHPPCLPRINLVHFPNAGGKAGGDRKSTRLKSS